MRVSALRCGNLFNLFTVANLPFNSVHKTNFSCNDQKTQQQENGTRADRVPSIRADHRDTYGDE